MGRIGVEERKWSEVEWGGVDRGMGKRREGGKEGKRERGK